MILQFTAVQETRVTKERRYCNMTGRDILKLGYQALHEDSKMISCADLFLLGLLEIVAHILNEKVIWVSSLRTSWAEPV
jgi:hypothetical protein